MIQAIEIENFRVFEQSQIDGFQQINLITGKNNAGKTSLLEAIYWGFGSISQKEEMLDISRHTNEDREKSKNLIFNPQTEKKIQLTYRFTEIHYPTNNGSHYNFEEAYSLRFILDKNTQIPIIGTITQIYDELSIDGKSQIVNDAVQLIDTSIEEIRTFSIKPNLLFVRRKHENNFLPINYFGDAIQKIVRYIANILTLGNSKKRKILLIDEIENGIHYTAQDEFWAMLFKLCMSYDIQLFATTHSIEMIQAYSRVAAQFKDKATYFELARHAITNQIIGIKHDLDTLEYELQTNGTFRGE